MKVLLHSNGPNVSTGYGVQAAQLLPQLRDAGVDVACSCTYGQQGSAGSWKGITLYPTGYEVHGNDVLHSHALHHFDNDERGGWIITLLDVWALQNPLLKEFNVAAWCPVDHYPCPSGVLEFFKRTNAVPIAMSRFGERLLFDAGLDPVYIPLAVDTTVMKPTVTVVAGGQEMSARDMLQIPRDAFVVGMVAMNKGWARDRKGFNEAFRAFAEFSRRHPEAILYIHAEQYGAAEGIDLLELAKHAGIDPRTMRWVDQYAYRLGIPAEMMAATYTAMDVLLSPSHGEGFCVPLIEAQACGTPVIATAFSSQKELASPEYGAAGWLVDGQPEWDPAQKASYVVPMIGDVINKLEAAYQADLVAMQDTAIGFARQYDARRVFDQYWVPFLASLEPVAPVAKAAMTDVAVIVPCVRNEENAKRLRDSFAATNDGSATLYEIEYGTPSRTYAENVNSGLWLGTESFVLVVGDDVEFKPGWLEAARKVSETADVIGTNDTDGKPRNPEVATGRHADHFFVRRSYIEEIGASLEGPGILMPEVYGHWWVDREVIGLAKARGVFTPCLDSVIVHHHPGYEGREDLRKTDPVYMKAVESAAADKRTFLTRAPLIEMQRVSRSAR